MGERGGGQCNSCRHWDRRFPQNQQLGVCLKMGVILWKDGASIVLRDEWDTSPPTSDVASVRTLGTFGCINHTPPLRFKGSSLP